MNHASERAILVTREAGVGLVTLNIPSRRNAIGAATAAELIQAIEDLEGDPQIRVIVLTGAPPAFSAGGDFDDLLAARAGEHDRLRKIYASFVKLLECRLPTIAAVNGAAVGAGMNLALSCDMRIAAASARFDTRFLRIGLHPGGGHTWLLGRAVGYSAAASMLLAGTVVTGAEAERIGLAIRCVADEALMTEVLDVARRMAECPRELLEAAKDSLRAATQSGLTHAAALELEYGRQLHSLQQPAFARIVGGKERT